MLRRDHTFQYSTGILDTNDPWVVCLELRKRDSSTLRFDKDKNQRVQFRVGDRWLEPQKLTSISDYNWLAFCNWDKSDHGSRVLFVAVPPGTQAVRLLLEWRHQALSEKACSLLDRCAQKLEKAPSLRRYA